MDRGLKGVIHAADKYARQKEYRCLMPGCQRKAIRSHAIPRASIAEALAEDGIVYTRRQSFNHLMTITARADPPEIVEEGINRASVFSGFCSTHDSNLFAPVERIEEPQKYGMVIPLHFRAFSLEYSRKRRSAEFYRKVGQLVKDQNIETLARAEAEKYEYTCSLIKDSYLGRMMRAAVVGSIEDKEAATIVSFSVLFSRNLEVSCCGCFQVDADIFDSVIAYNLISYADMSILVLTSFRPAKKFLDSFKAEHPLPEHLERLVNDVAFMKGEEPLIAAKLWRSLNEAEQVEVRLSLRHPSVRNTILPPRVIRIDRSFEARGDYNPDNLPPAFLEKLASIRRT